MTITKTQSLFLSIITISIGAKTDSRKGQLSVLERFYYLFGLHKNLAVGAGVWAFNEQYQCDDSHHIRIMEIRFGDTTLLWAARERIPTAKSEQ